MPNQFEYSRLTLRPLDAHERYLFRQFRMDDVKQQYQLFVVVFTLVGVAQVAMFLLIRDLTTLIDGTYMALLMVLAILVNALGSKISSERFQIWITALDSLIFILTVVSFALIVLYTEESQSDKALNLKTKLSNFQNALLFISMFHFSTMAHQIICVLCAALSFIALNSWLLLDTETEILFFKSITEMPVYIVLSFVIWYILQRRELKSFIRERKAEIKQQQQAKLLNSQSDAIVAVRTELKSNHQQQPNLRLALSDAIIFSNKKANQLFGFNLSVDPSQRLNQVGFRLINQPEAQNRGNNEPVDHQSLLQQEFEIRRLRSLAEILTTDSKNNRLMQADGQTDVEMYKMVNLSESQVGQNDRPSGASLMKNETRTLIVNRIPLTFNYEECNVVNFTDISTYEDLKKKQESYNLLKKLNAQVHHEMLVPLKVNVKMANRLLKGKITRIQRRLIENILVASNMVMLHAHDFLDQSLIEKGVFFPHHRPASLREVVLSTIKIIEITLEGKDLKIVYNQDLIDILPKVNFDERRFQQVLLNVLSNATKFQDKGQIEVQVVCLSNFRSLDSDSRLVRASVIDHGIGMTEKQLENIFTPFNESQKRGQYGGNGVGLSICKAICSSLNGHIEATSRPGEGTTVTFTQECFFLREPKKRNKNIPITKTLKTIAEEPVQKSEEIKEQNSKPMSIHQWLPKQIGTNFQEIDEDLLIRDPVEDQKESLDPREESKLGQSSNLVEIKAIESSKCALQKKVLFQGQEIFVDHFKQDPYSIQSSLQPGNDGSIQRLIQFLNANKAAYPYPNNGKIVVVDDQYVSQQLIILEIAELGTTNEVIMLSNGQEACDYFETCLSEFQAEGEPAKQPITLLLIDINMPIMTGMQAVEHIKQKYASLNQSRREQGKEEVVRPAMFYYSQYSRNQMQVFIKDEEMVEYYLEKPVPTQELRALFALMNILTNEQGQE